MLPQVERPGTLEKVITALQAVLKFLAPFEEPDSWHFLTTYQTTWSDLIQRFGFKKDPFGRVWLRGGANRSGGAVLVIGTLPVGYRPKSSNAPLVLRVPDAAGGLQVLLLGADGVLTYGGGAGATSIYFDSISFEAA